MTPPRTTSTTAEQHRLLLIQFKSAALDRKLQHLERGAFEVEELTTFLANQVHFFFAATRTRITVLQFIIFSSTDNLNHPRLFETGQVPIYGAERNLGQTFGNFRGHKNPVGIFGHEIHNHLSCLRLVFHSQLSISLQFVIKTNLHLIRKFKYSQFANDCQIRDRTALDGFTFYVNQLRF